MRKNYKNALLFGLGLMLSITNINAQYTNFQDLVLTPESFWDGSDLSGTHNSGIFSSEFISGDITFKNEFDTSWGAPGYWLGGFAYSNITDNTTEGPSNKHSAITGSGENNLPNYLVSTNNSYIKFDLPGNIPNLNEIVITNSTYAYWSMKNGDGFAKKFGGTSGDEQDWFKITIYAYYMNTIKDSVDFYLADYRFTDNSNDYIVDTWKTIDLSSFNPIDSLYFSLSSTDNSMWGMNTPAFFCIGRINETPVSVAEIDENRFELFPNPASDNVYLKSKDLINRIQILDLSGRIVKAINNVNSKEFKLSLSGLNSGVYSIQTETNEKKTTQRLIKQ
ncbi:MAG: DUF4465 domain-containing protein [Flavobacteriales bacterium]|nr:DUF4465 domain-containing protein [Flavobacteriales bacterium]